MPSVRGNATRFRLAIRLGVLLVTCGVANASCVVGNGTGFVTGNLAAPHCDIELQPIDFNVKFFAEDANEAADSALIRLQQSSDDPFLAPAIDVSVVSASQMRDSGIGVPYTFTNAPVSLRDRVHMTLHLLDRCSSNEESARPLAYRAIGGTITFDAIFLPWGNNDGNRHVRATFTDVHLVDEQDPDNRYADISGEFDFRYERGRSLQTFPR